MRRLKRWRRGSGLAVGLAAVSLCAAGCVNLPSGGAVNNVNPVLNSDVGSQLVITPRAPGSQWLPQDIVAGFLVASGADPADLSIARDYLTRNYASQWHPSSSPTVIDTSYKTSSAQVPSRVTGGGASYQVTVTSQHQETLVAAGKNEAGRLQVTSEPAPYKFLFELIQVGGKWRIDSIIVNGKPSVSILLLTDSDFERDYLPRDLYYVANGAPHTLVPYPVYVPAQTGQLDGVQKLVDAVGATPPTGSNWLYNAIRTAFPRGTHFAAQVGAGTATVTVTGTGADVGEATLEEMEAQLVWTLAYAPDSPGGTGINSVVLAIGRRSTGNLALSQFTSWIPQRPVGPLYYQTLDQKGRPRLWKFSPSSTFGSPNTSPAGASARGHRVVGGSRTPEPLQTGLGRGPFTAVAISPPSQRGVYTFAGCRGTKAYIAPLLPITEVESRDLPGKCTSLSWDNRGDCWAVAGSDVYVLNATPTALSVVSIPAQQIADNVVSLKVAPDGLRVAMIVRGKNGSTSVDVSAITKGSNIYLAQGGPVLTVGPDLVKPIALTWWDSDHLLVLDSQHDVSQLYDVPLNGQESTRVLEAPPNAVSVTADGSFVAVGTPGSAGQGHPAVWVSHGLAGPWIRVTAGRTPAYVG